MLSDEEKKALEILKDREYDFDELYCTFRQSFIKPYDKSIGIILELIEKQSKEIEEIKNITKSYDSFLGDEKIVIADKRFFVNGYFQENFVRKDKIKAKIEDILNSENSEAIEKLIEWKSLLEEE